MPIKNRESLLVREEDELGEGEDDQAEYTGASDRIALGKNARATEKKSRKEGMRDLIDEVMMEEEEGDLMGLSGEEEESRQWELAQIKRGEQGHRYSETDGKVLYKPATSEFPSHSQTKSDDVL